MGMKFVCIMAQDFCLSSKPVPYSIRECGNRRIASYVTVAATKKTDKKTSKMGGLFVASYLNIPKDQRHPPAPSLAEIAKTRDSRNRTITAAYATGEYSYQQIASFFNLHFTTVGNIVRAARIERTKNRL
jgi:DNA-directed RNA polymerase specialized sigma24 family protein